MRVVFRVGDVSVVCSVGNTDYQTLHEKELKLVEEEKNKVYMYMSYGRYMFPPPIYI